MSGLFNGSQPPIRDSLLRRTERLSRSPYSRSFNRRNDGDNRTRVYDVDLQDRPKMKRIFNSVSNNSSSSQAFGSRDEGYSQTPPTYEGNEELDYEVEEYYPPSSNEFSRPLIDQNNQNDDDDQTEDLDREVGQYFPSVDEELLEASFNQNDDIDDVDRRLTQRKRRVINFDDGSQAKRPYREVPSSSLQTLKRLKVKSAGESRIIRSDRLRSADLERKKIDDRALAKRHAYYVNLLSPEEQARLVHGRRTESLSDLSKMILRHGNAAGESSLTSSAEVDESRRSKRRHETADESNIRPKRSRGLDLNNLKRRRSFEDMVPTKRSTREGDISPSSLNELRQLKRARRDSDDYALNAKRLKHLNESKLNSLKRAMSLEQVVPAKRSYYRMEDPSCVCKRCEAQSGW